MAMKKETLTETTEVSLILILLAGLLSIEVACANPLEPNMTRPTVSFAFENPSSGDPGNLTFHLALTMPRDVYLTDVYYQLDSELPFALSTGRRLEPFHNFTANIAATPNQQHTLWLNIGIISPYDRFGTLDPHGHFVQTVAWDANQIVIFNVSSTGVDASLNYTIKSNFASPIYSPTPSTTITPTPDVSDNPSATPTLLPSTNQTRLMTVTLNSPKNQTYFSNKILVSVSASDPENHTGPGSVAYILDSNPQMVIAETPRLGLHSFTNSTEILVSDGSHYIVGVGITWFGGADGAFYSEPVYFTVSSPIPSATTTSTATPSPMQTLKPSPTPNNNQDTFAPLAIAVGLVIIGVVAALLLVFAKNRGKL